MSLVYLIRHGQASAHAADYDQLSPLGYTQSKAIQKICTEKISFDHVWIGPRKRHRQTYEEAMLPHWPTPIMKPWLDEFPAHEIMEQGMPTLKGTPLQEHVERIQKQVGTGGPDYLVVLQHLCDEWIEGKLVLQDVESGTAYLERIKHGVSEIKKELSLGKNIVIFSSAGAISSLVGESQHAHPKLALRNAWAVYNAAISVLRIHKKELMMASFNWIEHVTESQRTFV